MRTSCFICFLCNNFTTRLMSLSLLLTLMLGFLMFLKISLHFKMLKLVIPPFAHFFAAYLMLSAPLTLSYFLTLIQLALQEIKNLLQHS